MYAELERKNAPQQKRASDVQRSESLSRENSGVSDFGASEAPAQTGQGQVAMQFKRAAENTELNPQAEPMVQRKANNTGLPDRLKTGIENLSGYSMDDVKVHYNSSKPAQLQAHAYAQGTDIHLGPGQERHLPHEAWHVVQQKEGRVKPTVQMKGKMNVNDDAGLEREADRMGAAALGFHPGKNVCARSLQHQTIENDSGAYLRSDGPIQLIPIGSQYHEDAQYDMIKNMDMRQFIEYQCEFQKEVKKFPHLYKKMLTTVGFEHEFAEAKVEIAKFWKRDHPLLKGIDHLEIAKSDTPQMEFTDIPFILETDSNCVIELVSPPFLLQTQYGNPLPSQKLIDKVDDIMSEDLLDLADGAEDIRGLIHYFYVDLGINFNLEHLELEYYHVDYETPPTTITHYKGSRVDEERINNIPIKKQSKGKDSEIGQANIATDINNAYLMEDPPDWTDMEYIESMQKEIVVAAFRCWEKMAGVETVKNEKMLKFVHILARVLLTQMAVEPLKMLVKYQKEKYESPDHKSSHSKSEWNAVVDLTSFVKDNAGIWIKDSIINIGLGLGLSGIQWEKVEKLASHTEFVKALENIGNYKDTLKKYIESLVKPVGRFETAESISKLRKHICKAFRANIVRSLSVLETEASKAKDHEYDPDYFVPRPEGLPLYGHNDERHIRARQDTLLPFGAVNNDAMKVIWPHRRLHVVEIRRSGDVLDLVRERSSEGRFLGHILGGKDKLSKEYDALLKKIHEEGWPIEGRFLGHGLGGKDKLSKEYDYDALKKKIHERGGPIEHLGDSKYKALFKKVLKRFRIYRSSKEYDYDALKKKIHERGDP